MSQSSRQYGRELQLQGVAAVWQVASQLALRGHNVLFPGLDEGYDLKLESGIRLQIKSATITYKNDGYQRSGAYGFGIRRGAWDRKAKAYNRSKHEGFRPYSEVADYFVLWGVDENRFFILPTTHKAKAIWFTRRGAVSQSRNKALFDKLAEERRAQYEDRWDLLDLNATSSELIESAVEKVSEVTV